MIHTHTHTHTHTREQRDIKNIACAVHFLTEYFAEALLVFATFVLFCFTNADGLKAAFHDIDTDTCDPREEIAHVRRTRM